MLNLLAGLLCAGAAVYCLYVAADTPWRRRSLYVWAGANIVLAAANFLIVLVR